MDKEQKPQTRGIIIIGRTESGALVEIPMENVKKKYKEPAPQKWRENPPSDDHCAPPQKLPLPCSIFVPQR